VINALGLAWADLFPNGHGHAPKSRQPAAVTERPIVTVLAALATAGIGWKQTASHTLFVAPECPKCRAGSLWIADDVERVRMSCWTSGCESDEILEALEDLVTDWRQRDAA
jgi:hypothetical protein